MLLEITAATVLLGVTLVGSVMSWVNWWSAIMDNNWFVAESEIECHSSYLP